MNKQTNTNLTTRTSGVLNGAHLALLFMVGIYCLISQPFMSILIVSSTLRYIVEISTLCLLIILQKKDILLCKNYVLILFAIMVVILFVNDFNNYRTVITLAARMLFFFLFLALLARNHVTRLIFKNAWILFWGFISIWLILSFVCFELNIVKYHYLYLGYVSDWAGQFAQYQYYYHPLFGFISMTRQIFNYDVGRATSVIFEPGLLAFFLGLNIIASKYLFKKKSNRKIFIVSNFVAGCLTLSLTFYIVITISVLLSLLNKYLSPGIMKLVLAIIMGAVIPYIFLYKLNLVEESSFNLRSNTSDLALESIRNHSLYNFFFGEGIGSFYEEYLSGINSGLMVILVEWGLLPLLYVVFTLYSLLKSKFIILIYILVYSLAFNFFWYPIFWAGIALIASIGTNCKQREAQAKAGDVFLTS